MRKRGKKKMGIPKKEVYDFIEHQRCVAIKAVDEQTDKDINDAIEVYLDLPENAKLKISISNFEIYKTALREAQSVINKHSSSTTEWVRDWNMKAEIFKTWYPNIRPDSIEEIKAETENKKSKIRAEYSRISQICRGKKTGDQAKDFLKGLGFDVKPLEDLYLFPVVVNAEEEKFDTSLLFPANQINIRKEEN